MGFSTTCSCLPQQPWSNQSPPVTGGGYVDSYAYGYPPVQQAPVSPAPYPSAYPGAFGADGQLQALMQTVAQLTQLVTALTSVLQARAGVGQLPQGYPSIFDDSPPSLPPVGIPGPQQQTLPPQLPTPAPAPVPAPTPTQTLPPPASSRGQQAVDTAKAQLGKMYAWGGNGPDTFDCSGLVKFALKSVGADTKGRTTQDMWNEGTPVDKSQLQPGDVVYFGGPPPTHTAMYIGNGEVIHASTTGQPVKIAKLDNAGAYVGARRYT